MVNLSEYNAQREIFLRELNQETPRTETPNKHVFVKNLQLFDLILALRKTYMYIKMYN